MKSLAQKILERSEKPKNIDEASSNSMLMNYLSKENLEFRKENVIKKYDTVIEVAEDFISEPDSLFNLKKVFAHSENLKENLYKWYTEMTKITDMVKREIEQRQRIGEK